MCAYVESSITDAVHAQQSSTAQHLHCYVLSTLSDTPLACCCAAVHSQTYRGLAVQVWAGRREGGASGFGELSSYEKGWFDKMMPELKAQIKKGIEFANA